MTEDDVRAMLADLPALAGHLLSEGVDLVVVFQMLLGVNARHGQPPKPEAEVVEIFASAARGVKEWPTHIRQGWI